MTVSTEELASVPYLDLPAQMRGIRQEIDAALARTLDNCSMYRNGVIETFGQVSCFSFYPGKNLGAYGPGYQSGDFPVAEKAAHECLNLPIYPEMTHQQIERVVGVIKDFFAKQEQR